MNKMEMQKELNELIVRFRKLKKALDEDQGLSPAQRAAAEVANSLKTKPLTREQVLAKAKELAEQQHAQRLANQLQKAGILGTRAPPRQPTSEEMRLAAQNMWAQANGFSTQEELEKAEANWGNGINNWLVEAQKPINARFKSEEEEKAYWDRIKVQDSSGNGGGSGY
jgi:hypothetical protein